MEKQIKVAGVEYDVQFREKMLEDFQVLGLCDYNSSTIYLDPSLSQERMEQVLIHELVHAMLFEAGYDDQEEDLVNRLGIVLHQVLKDNDFYITEEEKTNEMD